MLSLLAIVATLGLAEVAVRLFVSVPVAPQMFEVDPYTDYRNKRNLSERAVWRGAYDYRWTTNSQGFRGTSEYRVPKPAGVTRVLVLGDSFTFGLGVADDETWPALVERRLRSMCASTTLEVVNAGVTAFGTSQQLVLLERDGLALDPDVVVYAFFVNDPEDNLDRGVHILSGDTLSDRPAAARPKVYAAKRLTEYVPGYRWLLRRSHLVNWIRQLYFRTRPGDLNVGAAPAQTAATPARDAARDERKWRMMRALLTRMQDLTRGHGAELLVVLIPHLESLSFYASGSQGRGALLDPKFVDNYDSMRAQCDSLSLRCVDVVDWFTTTSGSTDPASLFLPVDGHFARPGHDVTASAVTPRLASLLACGAVDTAAAVSPTRTPRASPRGRATPAAAHGAP